MGVRCGTGVRCSTGGPAHPLLAWAPRPAPPLPPARRRPRAARACATSHCVYLSTKGSPTCHDALTNTVSKGCMEIWSYVPWREGCTLSLHRQWRCWRQSTWGGWGVGWGGVERASKRVAWLWRGASMEVHSLPGRMTRWWARVEGAQQQESAHARPPTLPPPHPAVLGHQGIHVKAAAQHGRGDAVLARHHHALVLAQLARAHVENAVLECVGGGGCARGAWACARAWGRLSGRGGRKGAGCRPRMPQGRRAPPPSLLRTCSSASRAS